MADHYVCTGGCLTVRYAPGRCLTPGCPRHRNPLTLCNCTDDLHTDFLFKNNPNCEKLKAEYIAEHSPKKTPISKTKTPKKTKKV